MNVQADKLIYRVHIKLSFSQTFLNMYLGLKWAALKFNPLLEPEFLLLLHRCYRLTYSLTGRLAVSAISPLFVVRFGRSLRFNHLEFDKEAISDVFMAHRVFRGGGRVILESWASVAPVDLVTLKVYRISKYPLCLLKT